MIAAKKAVDLNPNNNEALMQLGVRTAYSGNWDTGYEIAKRAIRESPVSPDWYHWVPAMYYYQLGDFEKARRQAELAGLRRMPPLQATRAMIYGQVGDVKMAKSYLESCRKLDPNLDTRARELFAVHNFGSKDIERIMYGLRKAGLRIND